MTFPINLEKWQLRFRSREDIKIKFFRVCISRLLIICWYVLSKPVIATLHRRHYSHYAQLMVPLGIPLETQICNILHFIFRMIFSSQVYFQSEISGRHLRHDGGKGGTGRHLGGSRRLPGSSRKLQEAPGGSRRLREAKSDTLLSYNAKSSLKCKYYIVFVRVPFTSTAYLQ